MAMAKRAKPSYDIATMQPDELNALRTLVHEFVERLTNIENEVMLLKDDRKELLEEFSEKLDMKTLQAALRVVKISRGVLFRDTFDMFVEALTDPST